MLPITITISKFNRIDSIQGGAKEGININKTKFVKKPKSSTAPVDDLFGQIHDHPGVYQLCTANQEHHFQDLHPKGCPKNISFPTSKEAAELSQKNWKLQHVYDHAANQ